MSACPLCGGDPYAPVLRSWRFAVPMEPPSQNRIAQNKGGKRYQYRRTRLSFVSAFRVMARQYGIPAASGRRRVTLTRRIAKGGRRYDHGNLIGGCKPAVDALVEVGLVVDDRETYLEAYYRQERRPADPGLEVCIEEVSDG